MNWFRNTGLGMFIHWGMYSVHGRGEWCQYQERIPTAEYDQRYMDLFTADEYDPENYPFAKLSLTYVENAYKIYGVCGKKGGAKRTIGYVQFDKENDREDYTKFLCDCKLFINVHTIENIYNRITILL